MSVAPTPTTPNINRAAPPPTMSLADRRLIIDKLGEVYVDEKVGYSSGWSDRKVGVDLGVPPAWVAEIRTQNFGPEIVEGGHENQLKTIAKLREMFTAQVTVNKALFAKLERATKEIEALRSDLDQTVAGFVANASRQLIELEKQITGATVERAK